MKSFKRVAAESTCLKRVTVCELYVYLRHPEAEPGDRGEWELVSRASNRCMPPQGICSRLGVSNQKNDYPSDSSCNWVHAEIRALAAIPSGYFPNPTKAVIYGHDFPCPDCESALKVAGITEIEVKPEASGCGVRKAEFPTEHHSGAASTGVE